MTDHIQRPERPERNGNALVSAVCLALATIILALALTYI